MKKYLRDKWEDLVNWWHWDCDWFNFWRCRSLKRYIKRCWAWNKFFWKEEIEEWDHYFLCMIFAFALRRQADHIEGAARHLHFEKDVRNMRVAAKLIERFGKHEYGDQWLDEIAEKYMWFESRSERWEKSEIDETFGQLWKCKDLRPEDVQEAERREMKRLHKYEAQMSEQDIRLFGEYLRKYLKKWWE